MFDLLHRFTDLHSGDRTVFSYFDVSLSPSMFDMHTLIIILQTNFN